MLRYVDHLLAPLPADVVHGVLGHATVGGELAAGDGHEPAGAVKHRMSARQPGGGRGVVARADQGAVTGPGADNIALPQGAAGVAVYVAQQVLDVGGLGSGPVDVAAF